MCSFFSKSFVFRYWNHIKPFGTVQNGQHKMQFMNMQIWFAPIFFLLFGYSRAVPWMKCRALSIRAHEYTNNAFLTRLRHITINIVLCSAFVRPLCDDFHQFHISHSGHRLGLCWYVEQTDFWQCQRIRKCWKWSYFWSLSRKSSDSMSE